MYVRRRHNMPEGRGEVKVLQRCLNELCVGSTPVQCTSASLGMWPSGGGKEEEGNEERVYVQYIQYSIFNIHY